WTGAWFYAAGRAPAELAAWRQREADAGRFQECASESVGGYPFRIEVRCGGGRGGGPGAAAVELGPPAGRAAGVVPGPTPLAREFTGPLEISEWGRPPTYVASWMRGEGTVRGWSLVPERASLVLEALAVRDPGIDGDVIGARRVELQVRQARGSSPDRPPIE